MYAFDATNHAGERLRWYFDGDTQAARAYAFAHRRDYAEPSALESGATVPYDDIITDAGEFARWLTGDECDDALSVRDVF